MERNQNEGTNKEEKGDVTPAWHFGEKNFAEILKQAINISRSCWTEY